MNEEAHMRILLGSKAAVQTIISGVLWVIALNSYSLDVKTHIPNKAIELKNTVKTSIDEVFPDIPEYNYIPALIEHESCISLTHSKCWSPNSQLKTSREQGVGFFQLTRAWTVDGKLRFDTLSDLSRKYKAEIGELSWSNVLSRPDLQIKAGILLVRDNYKALYNVEDPIARLQFSDAAFNSGIGSTQKERRVCGLTVDCNPQLWIDNTENYCQRSKKPLYAGRSACDITKHHVRDVFFNRMPKYKEKYIIKVTKPVPLDPSTIAVKKEIEVPPIEVPVKVETIPESNTGPPDKPLSITKKIKNFFNNLFKGK